ncbi:MAG: hypothetical protein COB33_002485 [Thiotrichaceae bacterium]|nr:hypothetical protein [Thiotrichaceae bacterium]
MTAFNDLRPSAVSQRKLQLSINSSQLAQRTVKLQAITNQSSQQAVIQCEESLPDKIIRILANRNITVSPGEAAEYADALAREEQPRVGHHHRVLRIDRAGRVSSVKRHFSGKGMMGRVSEVEGPMAEDDVMRPDERLPMIGESRSHSTEVTLEGIEARAALSGVMDGSAAALSGIKDAEWLHMIGHQLGGEDIPENLVAGSHSLNTAMIPIENAVHDIASQKIPINYRVTFWLKTIIHPTTGKALDWVHTVETTVTVGDEGFTWTLTEQGAALDTMITEHNLIAIKESVARNFPR